MRSVFLYATLVLFLFSCSSQSKVGTTTSTPKKQEAKLVFPAQHKPTPANVNFVQDHENIFSVQEAKKLDSLVRIFEKSNLIAINIQTLNDPSVTVDNFDEQNKIQLESWDKLHGSSSKCMVISISKNLRRIRIDYGSFVNKLLTDDETKSIIENQFKPAYKQEQYFTGTWTGVNALMNTIRKNIKF